MAGTVSALVLVITLLGIFWSSPTDAQNQRRRVFRGTLNGFQEVVNPAGQGAVSTPATGDFRATLRNNETVMEYELSYQDLSADITQAHIHFGQPSTTGGIMVWLCQTPPEFVDPAGLAPTCPGLREGTVTGTITSDNVIGGAAAQGIAATEFSEMIAAMRNGAAYVNVHTRAFLPGEIRGNVR
jgi:CHRD domain